MRDRHLVLQHGLVELRRWKAPNGRMHAVPGRFELSCLACHCSHGKQQSPFKSALLWTCFGHALDMPSFFRRSFCLRKSLKVSETVGPNCLQSSLLQLFLDQQQVAACSAWCSSTSAEDFGTSSLEMVSPTHSHKVRRGCSPSRQDLPVVVQCHGW